MVEVFKTNVTTQEDASMLLQEIGKVFENHKVNFDLDDCDRILRVHSLHCAIDSKEYISLLKSFGFMAEILDDNINLPDELLVPFSAS